MLTVNEICEARDYLITMISLKTGTRPGALENLKLQEYSQAKADPNNLSQSAVGASTQEAK